MFKTIKNHKYLYYLKILILSFIFTKYSNSAQGTGLNYHLSQVQKNIQNAQKSKIKNKPIVNKVEAITLEQRRVSTPEERLALEIKILVLRKEIKVLRKEIELKKEIDKILKEEVPLLKEEVPLLKEEIPAQALEGKLKKLVFPAKYETRPILMAEEEEKEIEIEICKLAGCPLFAQSKIRKELSKQVHTLKIILSVKDNGKKLVNLKLIKEIQCLLLHCMEINITPQKAAKIQKKIQEMILTIQKTEYMDDKDMPNLQQIAKYAERYKKQDLEGIKNNTKKIATLQHNIFEKHLTLSALSCINNLCGNNEQINQTIHEERNKLDCDKQKIENMAALNEYYENLYR